MAKVENVSSKKTMLPVNIEESLGKNLHPVLRPDEIFRYIQIEKIFIEIHGPETAEKTKKNARKHETTHTRTMGKYVLTVASLYRIEASKTSKQTHNRFQTPTIVQHFYST